jgi:nitrite reductase/ring-hydroxylating ferredoxin subunit
MSIKSTVKSAVKSLTRRDVLKGLLNFAWAAPLTLSLVELFRFMRFEPPIAQITRFTLGAPSTLPTLPFYFEDGQIWLLQDAAGFYAVDSICTHLGCTVSLQKDGSFYCRCHGSRFTPDGSVLNGPATVPLRFVHLEWSNDGQLVVDRSQEVAKTVRLAAP